MAKVSEVVFWFCGRVVTVACVLAGAQTTSATAGKMHVLHVFCREQQCGDGGWPITPMVMDTAGNLYGTGANGSHYGGVVFELSPPQTGQTAWKYHVLYNFCSRRACKDGGDPTASTLILDSSGNLYGTTLTGGSWSSGTVFMLSPHIGARYWKITTLYSFCSHRQTCGDGSLPKGGLTYLGAETGALYDGVSPLYGETTVGGRHFGGTVFEIDPAGQGLWLQTTRYAFCAGGKTCGDGATPTAGLSIDASGNLYGLTAGGGATERGVVFKLTPQQGVKSWTETVLYNFCSQTNCTDGDSPSSPLLVDASGNLFGTTESGGSSDYGVLYEISAAGTYSVLHSFCSGHNCTDGRLPGGGMVMDSSGSIFGVTDEGGGAGSFGTIYKWNGSSLQRLHHFVDNRYAGIAPQGLTMDGAGNLFGSTANDSKGRTGRGTAFEFVP